MTGCGRRRFAVLGPLRAWCGDVRLDLGPVRQQALLAALLLRPGVTVSRQQLLDGVWGPEPPGTGAKVIPVYVHQLRRRLGPEGGGPSGSPIVTERGGYRFRDSTRQLSTDVARLREIRAPRRAPRVELERLTWPPRSSVAVSDALELVPRRSPGRRESRAVQTEAERLPAARS
ncbi:hypothetical protein SGLAM104S_06309 [Streptomyces glaucescens]